MQKTDKHIKSNRQLFGTDFPLSGEWDAGVTHNAPHGRWTVRRDPDHFVVIFHHFQNSDDVLLDAFDPTEEGEIAAKNAALAAREEGRRLPSMSMPRSSHPFLQ